MDKPPFTCAECRWCEAMPDPSKIVIPGHKPQPPRGPNDPDGVCMFNPPMPFPLGGNQVTTLRPAIRKSVDYCGRFTPKKEPS